MKRSEMIKNIASELIHEYTNFMSFDKAQELADVVLIRIEQEGMLPPSAKFKDPGHFSGDEFEYSLNEWEPEDESLKAREMLTEEAQRLKLGYEE